MIESDDHFYAFPKRIFEDENLKKPNFRALKLLAKSRSQNEEE
jgi:hypothetical protein